ncbi:mRNA splicing protein (nucleomorph) [Bigelowiella natans]|uniref:Small nuclear ribonucleoprotein E n=1 Tax=Bigelowiella natans TaxID=227086 RepID=Q3LWL6_BIGNA|nr:mRNA splicing protein [Bigelowiella natans]ABA27150.1 mRNA splicing protein [Bigelowiella natans]
MKKLMVHPINLLYRYLIGKNIILVCLKEKNKTINGKIIGFDEYMNIVLSEAVAKNKEVEKIKNLILVKGNQISELSKNFS